MPVKTAVRFTMERERQPTCSSCSLIRRHSGGRRIAVRRAFPLRNAIPPTASKKATRPAGSAARPPRVGVRNASEPIMSGSYRRVERVSNPRPC